MYHRGVEEGGGVAAKETQKGETEESCVRQEAAETRTLSLGTVEERKEPWDLRKMAIEEDVMGTGDEEHGGTGAASRVSRSSLNVLLYLYIKVSPMLWAKVDQV